MKVILSDVHEAHVAPFEIVGGREKPAVEHPGRVTAIRDALKKAGEHSFQAPEHHGDAPVVAVHDAALLHHLEDAWRAWAELGNKGPAMPDTFAMSGLIERPIEPPGTIEGRLGYFCFDMSTPILEGTYAAVREAADIALTGAREVLRGEQDAYALCRPPGHHVATSIYGGYSYLNNSSIAARFMQRETGSKVALLDVDYHHGNGTQEIFWNDPNVLTVSLHGDPDYEYPYFTGRVDETGGDRAVGSNFNIPLPKGTTGERFLIEVERGLDAVAGFGAEMIVVPFGADTASEDPLGTFELHAKHYRSIGEMLRATGAQVLVVQEGGYDVAATAVAVTELLAGLDGDG